MTAARTGDAEVMKALLGPTPTSTRARSTRGQTALMWAAAENNAAAIKVLVEGRRRRQRAHERRRGSRPRAARRPSAACSPAATGAAAAAAAAPRSVRLTPRFIFAVQLGQLDAVRALLEAGANVNDTLPDGTSALVLATQNGHWELGAFLIDQGADVNAEQAGLDGAAPDRRASAGPTSGSCRRRSARAA